MTAEEKLTEAASHLYDAECALHNARQTHVDSWITAAADHLHAAVAELDAAELECSCGPVPDGLVPRVQATVTEAIEGDRSMATDLQLVEEAPVVPVPHGFRVWFDDAQDDGPTVPPLTVHTVGEDPAGEVTDAVYLWLASMVISDHLSIIVNVSEGAGRVNDERGLVGRLRIKALS